MRKRRLAPALAATVLWLCFIYARSAQPASVSHEESSAVLGLMQRVLPFANMLLVRKLAHFIEYAVLGALLWLDWRLLARGRILLPLGAGLLFAAGDELLQTFIPGRSGEPLDVALDFVGVCAAVLLAQYIRRRKERSCRAG